MSDLIGNPEDRGSYNFDKIGNNRRGGLLFLHKIVYNWGSLESPRQGDSNETLHYRANKSV